MMRARTWFTFTVLAASLLVRVAGAAEFDEKRFYLTPFVGWTFFDSDRHFSSGQRLSNDVYFGGRAGVRLTDQLWFDLAGGYTGTKDCASCTESWTHYSANLMLSRAARETVNPFISFGGGWSRFKHAIGAAENSGTIEAAGGLRVRLNEALGIRLEARDVLALSKSGGSNASMNDVVVGAGLTFGFGGGSKELASASPSARESDSDGDGVPDSRDDCPNTPRGCVVDAHGCPIDSDGDGVCDGRDKCPGTAAGVVVDKDGCPVVAHVEKLETELLDTGKIVLINVEFDFDQSTIRPSAYEALDTVGRLLTKWPGLKIEIGAYTDSRGTEVYNYALSHRRGESVRAYLLEHFTQFEPTQLTSKDFGESNPLAPNTSEANMQVNRRVEFVVLNTENLKRQK